MRSTKDRQVNSDITNNYIGCFADNSPSEFALGTLLSSSNYDNTNCVAFCMNQGFSYAATEKFKFNLTWLITHSKSLNFISILKRPQNGKNCYCGNQYGSHGQLDACKCDNKCLGNNSQICGGQGASSVFQILCIKSIMCCPSTIF